VDMMFIDVVDVGNDDKIKSMSGGRQSIHATTE